MARQKLSGQARAQAAWEGSAADSWIGRYGSLGVWIAGVKDEEYLPSNVRLTAPVMTFAGTKPILVTQNPSESVKAIHKPDGLTKILAMLYGGYLTFDDGTVGWEIRLTLPDGEKRLTLYFYDHYGSAAKISFETLLPGGAQLEPPMIFAEYAKGIYVTRTIPGSCIIRIRRAEGSSSSPAGVTGIFLDPPLGPPPDTTAPVITGEIDETGTILTITANEPVSGNTGFLLSGQYSVHRKVVDEEPIFGMTMELMEQTETVIKYRITRTREVDGAQVPTPIYEDEKIALTYLESGDVKDMAGNALIPFVGLEVQNNSMASGPKWLVKSLTQLMFDAVNGEDVIIATRKFTFPVPLMTKKE